MSEFSWEKLRRRRMAEPGATPEYEATRLAYELGKAVRDRREQRGWSQSELARAAGMTQSAVARFEAGGTVPTLVVLERLARALDAELSVQFRAKQGRPATA
ncbi:MAG: helix-turn-helix transcriptional regulator [Hamadaea sp.]|uniref:helix-turn-helix domain-containing protein n=1 Tax=Hamadaea sp. TaxID=2024425 RepID=UPI0018193614|nr:helix-turn-helix transcriptional regulator [Hamadaea sp.]NUR69723.1 helix-turn-helix transcriptional regulator [Hamadaea sp.]NUT23488.1 helix-turn-helix transcriptional regulator [Hamadaea sp.]